MRYLASLLAIVLLPGCESTDDTYVPGRIPRERAIAIAMQANKQYPYPLSKVTRSSWRPEQGYWAIDFKITGNFTWSTEEARSSASAGFRETSTTDRDSFAF